MFVCLYSEMDRLRTDHEIDMFKCLKKARTQRWGLVPRLVRFHSSVFHLHTFSSCCRSSTYSATRCWLTMLTYMFSTAELKTFETMTRSLTCSHITFSHWDMAIVDIPFSPPVIQLLV